MTFCTLLTLTFTASYVAYKKASTLSHSLYNYLLYFTLYFVTTVLKLKMCDFSGQTFKGSEML